MGCELVEGRDLVVGDDDVVYMRTIDGWQRVDVIYRRVDDLFLDPEVFRADSTLGVRGLMRAWRAGKVALANAPGAGVADDKLVYTFVPAMIRYYLDQDAILPNVPSYPVLPKAVQCEHVLANLATLVVKPANESGGYGMLMGPKSTAAERAQFAELIRAQSAQLHRPAGDQPVDHPDTGRRRHRAAAPGSASVHSLRARGAGDHRRPDARGDAQGIAGGQFLAGRRQQGHLDRRYLGRSCFRA